MSCSTASASPVKSPIEVVIVDDAEDIRCMLEIHLSLDERTSVVDEGASGLDAIRLAQRRHPTVMILDVMMPGGSGIDALPLIKRASPATKVIIYSAKGASVVKAEATDAGADAFVEKSAPLSSLTDTIIELAGCRPQA